MVVPTIPTILYLYKEMPETMNKPVHEVVASMMTASNVTLTLTNVSEDTVTSNLVRTEITQDDVQVQDAPGTPDTQPRV